MVLAPVSDVRTLHELELELRRREHEDPLALAYKPYPIQQDAHRCRRPFLLVVGGNRSGKSWYAVSECMYYATGRTVYAEVPTPPVTVWYVMPSLTMFRRSILPIIRKLAPRSEIALTQNGDIITKKDSTITFRNGSTIHFLSSDMTQRRLQGAEVDLVVMDETPNEEVYEELKARVLSRRGRVILVFAPIDVSTFWVRDKVYIPWQLGENPDLEVVHMPVADREGNPLVPHFTREDVQKMERQWPDPTVRAARIYGEFITRSGIVFRNFDPEVHIIRPFEIPDNYSRWFVVDPQYHRFAALYFAADEYGNYYVTDEYFSQDDTLAARAERMAVVAGQRDRAVPCYVDSANPQDRAELNWHFQRVGAPIGATELPFTKKVDTMVLRVHALLEPDEDRKYPKITGLEDCHGAPRLFFFDRLISTWNWNEVVQRQSRLFWELKRLSWGKDGKPAKESADGADCCDALTYGASILQAGAHLPEIEDWQKKLSPGDVLLWKAIERQDRMKTFLRREW